MNPISAQLFLWLFLAQLLEENVVKNNLQGICDAVGGWKKSSKNIPIPNGGLMINGDFHPMVDRIRKKNHQHKTHPRIPWVCCDQGAARHTKRPGPSIDLGGSSWISFLINKTHTLR